MELRQRDRNELISKLMNPNDNMPTDEDLRAVVEEGTDALTAKWRLRFLGYSSKNCELALQRAISRGVLALESDWQLKVT